MRNRSVGWSTGIALALLMVIALAFGSAVHAGEKKQAPQDHNKKASEEKFMDWGFGLFIHWGPVAQIGKEISWPVHDASQEFRDKYFSLYKTFNPVKFNPERWAELAKDAGMEYVVFTTKHHAGFCMYDSKYTDYDIMNTPYGKDITARVGQAFRDENVAVGWYYSPSDWHYLYKTGHKGKYDYGMVVPKHTKPYGTHNLTLLEYERKQIEELLTNYGKTEVMWYDGNATGLKKHTWKLAPDVLIARSVIKTPEQKLPKKPLEGPWETCMTMGRQWDYKPNDNYKSVTQLVHNLVKIRAMGGNYLLNVGPKPDGTLPEPQVRILKGLARWMKTNAEAIHGVRAWKTPQEGDVWFTRKKDRSAVYAVMLRWPEKSRVMFKTLKDVPVKSVRLLGMSDELEWEKGGKGLSVHLPSAKPCDHAWTLKIVPREQE